jgi:hypothetical protein
MIPTPPPIPPAVTPKQIILSLCGCLVVVFGADFLFWGAAPGISLGIFCFILMGSILATRELSVVMERTTLILSLLLTGAIAASILEISFTNISVLLGLFIMLAGETFFLNRQPCWTRWFSQIGGLLRFPGRLFWAWRSSVSLLPSSASGTIRIFGWLAGVLLPVLLLTLIFSCVLGSGNAILGSWINKILSGFWSWIVSFDFSIGRILFWILIAPLSLAFIRPSEEGKSWWGWLERDSRFAPSKQPSFAYWRSVLILIALNLLFFAANSIDCFYLWAHQEIPAGSNYTEYVHQGTAQLIIATILSALVLISIFHQDVSISEHSLLKGAALLWIAQNIFLLTSVALRLKFYVDASGLTPLRISLLIFLLIVATGFVLLSCKIMLDKSLPWLLGANAALVFAVFYIVQFLDLGSMAASYNVSRWEKDPSHPLDIHYLQTLGSGGWGALRHVALKSDRSHEFYAAVNALDQALAEHKTSMKNKNWRSWQARRTWNERYLSPNTLPGGEN